MNDFEKAQRGEKAAQLLEDPLLQETLAALKNAYVEAWTSGKTVEAREDAHRYVMLCKKFVDDLKSVAKDGTMAAHRTKELEGKPPRRIFG